MSQKEIELRLAKLEKHIELQDKFLDVQKNRIDDRMSHMWKVLGIAAGIFIPAAVGGFLLSKDNVRDTIEKKLINKIETDLEKAFSETANLEKFSALVASMNAKNQNAERKVAILDRTLDEMNERITELRTQGFQEKLEYTTNRVFELEREVANKVGLTPLKAARASFINLDGQKKPKVFNRRLMDFAQPYEKNGLYLINYNFEYAAASPIPQLDARKLNIVLAEGDSFNDPVSQCIFVQAKDGAMVAGGTNLEYRYACATTFVLDTRTCNQSCLLVPALDHELYGVFDTSKIYISLHAPTYQITFTSKAN